MRLQKAALWQRFHWAAALNVERFCVEGEVPEKGAEMRRAILLHQWCTQRYNIRQDKRLVMNSSLPPQEFGRSLRRAHPHPKATPQGQESSQAGRIVRRNTLDGTFRPPQRSQLFNVRQEARLHDRVRPDLVSVIFCQRFSTERQCYKQN